METKEAPSLLFPGAFKYHKSAEEIIPDCRQDKECIPRFHKCRTFRRTMSMLKFNRKYFVLAILVFVVEVLIALFAHDRIVRPYIGDFLVVILIYCFFKSFINTPVLITGALVLIFSYAVEVLQYFNIAHRLGLQKSRLAKIIMGSSFEWTDIIMYTAGIIVVFVIEKIIAGRTHIKPHIKSA